MSDPVSIVQRLSENGTDESIVNSLVAPDATYVSLCYSNPDLQKIMPYAGTHFQQGPAAIFRAFTHINRVWDREAFEIEKAFGSGKDVAMFGRLIFRSKSLGKACTSPFAIRAEVEDGRVTYFQFMEDTLATASTFAKTGKTVYRVEGEEEFEIVVE